MNGIALKRGWFQTLMHIAVTSLWLLPVIHCKAAVRVLWMLGSALLHVLLSYWFYYIWVNTAPNGIDGGPLGFLTWTIPAVVGTLACDVFVQPRVQLQLFSASLFKVLLAALLLMGLGWVISCGTRFYDVPGDRAESRRAEKLDPNPVIPPQERIDAKLAEGNLSSLLAEPPFVRPPDQVHRKWNYWMMSQRGGTLAYLTFSAGFSLAVYLIFYVVSDLWGFRLAFFRTFGTNALFAYVLHSMVSSAVQPFFPEDSPAWYAYSGLVLFFAITWVIVRHLEKQGLYLRA